MQEVRFRSLVATCLIAFGTSAAVAKGWPAPAAGPSKSGDPELLFTFDDGPNPKTTPEVLDTLAKHHIHAVFFLVGDMVVNPKTMKVKPDAQRIIERILREGHVIGTHTMTHKDLCKIKEDRAVYEIDDGKAAIDGVAGMRSIWFRVPGGVRCKRLEDMLAERHLQHFHWDLDPQEWKHKDAKKAFKYVTTELAKSADRNVLLMHDVKIATVKALPEILDWLDAENARRTAAHKRPIRVIQAPELAIERLPEGLLDFLRDVAPDPHALAEELASVLP